MQAHRVQLMQQPARPIDLGQQIAHIIRTISDPETLLNAIATALGQAFEADGCLVALQDNHLPQQIYGYPSSTQAVLSSESVQQIAPAAMQALLEDSDLLAISNLESDESNRARAVLWQALEVQAILGIQTRFQGQVNGGIVVMHSQPYCWTDSNKELLQEISEPVAIAISQVLQAGVIGSLQKQVGAFTQHRNLINKLTMAIHNALDLNQILQMAIDGVAQTFQVNQGLILLLKYADPLFATRSVPAQGKRIPKARATIVCEASEVIAAGEPEPQQPASTLLNQSFWVSECALCALAFTDSPKPLAIADKRQVLTLDSDTRISSIFNPEGMPALLLVPLIGVPSGSISAGTILGFLALQHSSPRPWATDELELVELVSAQVSTAIIQTQTMQHVQALVEERTAQLQSSLEVQGKLYEKTRQQIDQLRRLNQLKDEFLATMSHELRTPLTSMTLAIRMLRQPGLSEDRRDRYLDILEQQCNQETNLINDLLTLQKFESNQADLQLQKVDLKQLISDIGQPFEEKWAAKKLTLVLDLPKQALKIQTDKDSLNRILEELLTNAGKYAEPGSAVVLRAHQQVNQSNHEFVLSVSNTGQGISPEELPHIFDKFRRGQGVTQQAIAGTGLGLALVKCLVQHLNATINVSSNALDAASAWETCFTLTLPQVFDSTKI
ncbi:GAF domain-containing sensor histidine kinase [Microcoleus sp. FACHB-672]|nr:GAF domain-containing sensor histidine kinase [Microcoleus sp. FACHB-672]